MRLRDPLCTHPMGTEPPYSSAYAIAGRMVVAAKYMLPLKKNEHFWVIEPYAPTTLKHFQRILVVNVAGPVSVRMEFSEEDFPLLSEKLVSDRRRDNDVIVSHNDDLLESNITIQCMASVRSAHEELVDAERKAGKIIRRNWSVVEDIAHKLSKKVPFKTLFTLAHERVK